MDSCCSCRVMPCRVSRWQADIVFWLGDLNYRIAEDVPDEVVFEMLKSDNLEFLRRVGCGSQR